MSLRIYAGPASVELAQRITMYLGASLGPLLIGRFADGEVRVEIGESVRGVDVYLVQSTDPPVNEHLMELLVMIDAFRRAAARSITAVIPYYGYARQEKKSTWREPITAKLVANLITKAGANRVISFDLHAPAIQGFFDIDMEHLAALPVLADYLMRHREPRTVVVAPDVGRLKMAERYAHALDAPLAVVYKRRTAAGQPEARAVVGDVRNAAPIIVDDIIATGGTIAAAVDALLRAGARPEIRVAAVHPLLVGNAPQLLDSLPLRELVVTDTVVLPPDRRPRHTTILSVDQLLAETIRRIHEGRSVSVMYTEGEARRLAS